MNPKFLKPYNPLETEPPIYKKWEESGFFNPDVCVEKGITAPDAPPFSMVLPPPNVTGILHLGSSLMGTIQDIYIRKNRMAGKRTLWIPGTDHAAIATQSVVEKKLDKEEGKRRHDLGREAFLEKVNAYAEESKAIIQTQLRALGCSLDWSREAYTLDEKRNRAVKTVFKKMHDDGLIYRKNRVINWDPKGQTTISDDEIVHEEREATMYTFKYSADFPISISTTRPETKFGDTAVAVHPEDGRYQHYIGQTFKVEFLGEPLEIKVIADHEVDKEYGTGALGVTPSHSMVDYEIAERHQLLSKQVIDEYGKMTIGPEGVRGKKTAEARKKVAELLKEEGLIEKEEIVRQNLSTAQRSGAVIEPLPKLQWFINVNKPIAERGGKSLKQLMLEAPIEFVPDRFKNIYEQWIKNLRDWCISRQIWFGHRIPVWYRAQDAEDLGAEMYVGLEAPEGEGWEQDSDTLDTWFSSGLWTFSTLGWPEQTADLATYHPTHLLETGSDLVFFWVARMILMSQYVLGEIPFKAAYFHGLVRDEKGRKISKSLGNNIDPIDMGKKYGTDALRMSQIIGTQPGADSKMSEEKIKAYQKFANKLWNITRFVLTSNESLSLEAFSTFAGREYHLSSRNAQKDGNVSGDAVLLEELNALAKEVTEDIDAFRLHLAAEKLYHYVWHSFADIILEESKPIITGVDAEAKATRQRTLQIILETCLKLLHPFMPFITEEIWQSMKKERLLMVEKWPIQ
jgi:valyl-tRNA synthetase